MLAVERETALWYDGEEGRDGRPLDPRRVTARERFVELVHRCDLGRPVLEIGTGPGRDPIPSIDDPPAVMAHHDLNFSQCVWRDGHLVGLVDLEMSHANSSDWDIVDLLGMCANPRGRAPTAAIEQRVHPDQFDRVAYWFHEVYPEPFDHPSILQRLRVYDLVYRLAELRQRPYTRGILSTLEVGTSWEHLVPTRSAPETRRDFCAERAP